MSKERIGEVLLRHKLIDAGQLETALRAQRMAKPRKPLGQVLVDRLIVTERQLLQVLDKSTFYPRLAGARILVVEDKLAVQRLLAKIFSSVGAEVICAKDGLDAQSRLLQLDGADRQIDLVTLDLQMPRMDGTSLLPSLRANVHSADAAVVVVTGRADRARIQTCAAYGVDTFVIKPFSTFGLLERCEGALAARAERLERKPEPSACDHCETIIQTILAEVRQNPERKTDPLIRRILADYAQRQRPALTSG